MPFGYSISEKGAAENVPNIKRLNSLTDSIIPTKGSSHTQRLSGAGAQVSQQLSGGVVYMVVGTVPFHAASSGSTFSAAATDTYFPQDMVMIHIPETGKSDFISVIAHNGGTVECYIAMAENRF